MAGTSEVFRTNGFDIFVERHGRDAGRETVVLVNGALSTTASFRQAARFLEAHFNVILYDLPYAGQSQPLNRHRKLVTKDDEVLILRALVDHFGANHIISVSWGGVAALLVLASGAPTLRSGVVNSFSPAMNAPMLAYVQQAHAFIKAERYADAATLLNSTVGKFLPRLLKLYNHKYLTGIDASEADQVLFHIRQILDLNGDDYLARLAGIDLPVLFVNGEEDDYTSPADVLGFKGHVRRARFATIPGAGHFLEAESRQVCNQVRELVLRFLVEQGVSAPVEAPLRPRVSAGHGRALSVAGAA